MLTNQRNNNINAESLNKTIVKGNKNPNIISSKIFKYLLEIILTKLLK